MAYQYLTEEQKEAAAAAVDFNGDNIINELGTLMSKCTGFYNFISDKQELYTNGRIGFLPVEMQKEIGQHLTALLCRLEFFINFKNNEYKIIKKDVKEVIKRREQIEFKKLDKQSEAINELEAKQNRRASGDDLAYLRGVI